MSNLSMGITGAKQPPAFVEDAKDEYGKSELVFPLGLLQMNGAKALDTNKSETPSRLGLPDNLILCSINDLRAGDPIAQLGMDMFKEDHPSSPLGKTLTRSLFLSSRECYGELKLHEVSSLTLLIVFYKVTEPILS